MTGARFVPNAAGLEQLGEQLNRALNAMADAVAQRAEGKSEPQLVAELRVEKARHFSGSSGPNDQALLTIARKIIQRRE